MVNRPRLRRRPISRRGLTSAGWAIAEVEEALSVPADPTAAAFFDVDNTMMRGASTYHFARGLAARKHVRGRDLVRYGWQHVRFRVVTSEHAGHIASSKAAALSFVSGWGVDEMERLCEEIFDDVMADRIWSGTRALAQLHLDAGQRVWLVTAAPVELGRIIANRLGLTGALGTVAETDQGVYTGHLVGGLLHGPAKADVIRELAEQEGLDLARCAAYSDSINDTPMLSLVGKPVAVNPDAALRREARRRGWEIRDYRTGRKAAKIAAPVLAGAGLLAGAVGAGKAVRRRSARR
ncbi:MAG: HAD-IB family hydrolase [Micromonosporaceae bacterium]|nr:HAD-IB family hydrolase [Micromonosporaceae bacterium]